MIKNIVNKEELIRIAIDNLKNSYAPYSSYNVSAAVIMNSGKVYTGVNIENASYPAGMCAERNAIYNAISCGEKGVLSIAIVGGKNCCVKGYCPPCGICRQVIREFCNPEKVEIILAKSVSDFNFFTLNELLPLSFGPNSLLS